MRTNRCRPMTTPEGASLCTMRCITDPAVRVFAMTNRPLPIAVSDDVLGGRGEEAHSSTGHEATPERVIDSDACSGMLKPDDRRTKSLTGHPWLARPSFSLALERKLGLGIRPFAAGKPAKPTGRGFSRLARFREHAAALAARTRCPQTIACTRLHSIRLPEGGACAREPA
jgi:hypothetical protein